MFIQHPLTKRGRRLGRLVERWAEFHGSHLLCFDHPNDTHPRRTIDLLGCDASPISKSHLPLCGKGKVLSLHPPAIFGERRSAPFLPFFCRGIPENDGDGCGGGGLEENDCPSTGNGTTGTDSPLDTDRRETEEGGWYVRLSGSQWGSQAVYLQLPSEDERDALVEAIRELGSIRRSQEGGWAEGDRDDHEVRT